MLGFMIYGEIKRLPNCNPVIALRLFKIKGKDGFLWKISSLLFHYIQIMVIHILI